jgi:hypothetical protein
MSFSLFLLFKRKKYPFVFVKLHTAILPCRRHTEYSISQIPCFTLTFDIHPKGRAETVGLHFHYISCPRELQPVFEIFLEFFKVFSGFSPIYKIIGQVLFRIFEKLSFFRNKKHKTCGDKVFPRRHFLLFQQQTSPLPDLLFNHVQPFFRKIAAAVFFESEI